MLHLITKKKLKSKRMMEIYFLRLRLRPLEEDIKMDTQLPD